MKRNVVKGYLYELIPAVFDIEESSVCYGRFPREDATTSFRICHIEEYKDITVAVVQIYQMIDEESMVECYMEVTLPENTRNKDYKIGCKIYDYNTTQDKGVAVVTPFLPTEQNKNVEAFRQTFGLINSGEKEREM